MVRGEEDDLANNATRRCQWIQENWEQNESCVPISHQKVILCFAKAYLDVRDMLSNFCNFQITQKIYRIKF